MNLEFLKRCYLQQCICMLCVVCRSTHSNVWLLHLILGLFEASLISESTKLQGSLSLIWISVHAQMSKQIYMVIPIFSRLRVESTHLCSYSYMLKSLRRLMSTVSNLCTFPMSTSNHKISHCWSFTNAFTSPLFSPFLFLANLKLSFPKHGRQFSSGITCAPHNFDFWIYPCP